MVSHFEVFDQN